MLGRSSISHALRPWLRFCTVAALAVAGIASPGAATARSPACALSDADSAWLAQTVKAWSVTRASIYKVGAPKHLPTTIFDAHCAVTSASALRGRRPQWTARPIGGPTLTVGTGDIPIGVFSAAMSGADGRAEFAMSTPSVWRAAKVRADSFPLELLMTAVLIHEATHVFQNATAGDELSRLQKQAGVPDDAFNDNVIQAIFGKDADFSASIARETDLFFRAARSADVGEAKALARQALAAMQARRTRYFIGDQAYQSRAEDLWLTMEGVAQWGAYRWLRMAKAEGGGGLDEDVAMKDFARRGQSWTQLLGIAIAMTVDRLAPDTTNSLLKGNHQTLVDLARIHAGELRR